ncbi:MAG: hypothetical protein MUO85_10760 [candidate division Zixibacteria bacterium]|nr:hypothetical protein [candidate division Zixibacteria bacterium]
MPRLVVTLKQADLKQLVAVARRERRLPPEQAVVFMLRGLAVEADALPQVIPAEADLTHLLQEAWHDG